MTPTPEQIEEARLIQADGTPRLAIANALATRDATIATLTTERDAAQDRAADLKHELNEGETLLTTIRFAVRPDSETVNGWRPSRGVDAIVDLALTVREERDTANARAEKAERALAAIVADLTTRRETLAKSEPGGQWFVADKITGATLATILHDHEERSR